MNTAIKTPTLATTSTGTGQLVDRFGRLKAEAADLASEMEDIKTVLIDREGESKLEGELFRLSISHSLRSTVDWKSVTVALAKKAGMTEAQLDALIALNTSNAATWVARSNARVTKA